MTRIPMKTLAGIFLFAAALFAVARADWADGGNPVCLADGHQTNAAMAAAGAGSAIVLWEDFRSIVHEQVYLQRLDAAGGTMWRANGVLASPDSNVDAHGAIVSDGGGGAIVAWDDFRNGGADVYLQSIGPSGAIRWSAGGVAACAIAGDQMEAVLAPDGAGGVIAAWIDYRNGGASDVYAQRISSFGAPQWTAGGVAVCTAAQNQRYLKMAADGAGGAIVAWEDSRAAGTTVVHAQRLDASGNPLWTVDGVAVSTAAVYQYNPTVAPSGGGGAIVAWEEWPDDTHGNVLAQRIDASGARAWGETGVSVWEHSGEITYWRFPVAMSDGAGGAVLAWDYWDGLSSDMAIYAQRLTGDGMKLWPPGGVLASSSASMGTYEPAVAPDGAGGAIVAWEDSRASMELDVYAQRIDAGGAIQWTPGGVPVCAVAGYQTAPAIVSDGAGGALVAWTDFRGGEDADIYAARLFPDGAVTGVDRPPPRAAALEQNYPNPFNPSTRIAFYLPAPGRVSIRVHDAAGRLVRALADGEYGAGRHEIAWDGRDGAGAPAASGVYLCRMSAGGAVNVRKLVLLR